MTDRLKQIERLSKQVPVVNAAAKAQIDAGNQIQLQQALGGAAPAAPTTRTAQAVAPQATQAAVQSGLQMQQANQQQATALGGQALSVQANQAERDLQTRKTGQEEGINKARNKQALKLNTAELEANERLTRDDIESTKRVASLGMERDNNLLNLSLDQREQLASIGRDVKQQIFDSRLEFERDEAGRKFSNERQLADYALANAKTEQEFQGRMREMQQESDRKVKLLEHTHKQLSVALERGWLKEQQKLDYEQRKYLIEMQRQIEAQIAKDKAANNNRMMIAQGLGTVVGAVVGTIVAPGAGTVVGASAGGALGTSIAGATA